MLAGTNWGHIVACRADGTVGDRGWAGGLVGVNGGNIHDSYAIDEVTAFESMGVGGGQDGTPVRSTGATRRHVSQAKRCWRKM